MNGASNFRDFNVPWSVYRTSVEVFLNIVSVERRSGALNAGNEEQLAACKSLILSNGIVNLLLVLFTIVAWTTFCKAINAEDRGLN